MYSKGFYPHRELNFSLRVYCWTRTCTIYLVSKIGMVAGSSVPAFLGLFQPGDILFPFVLFKRGTIGSLGSHTPFTLHRQLKPQSTSVDCQGGRGTGDGGVEILHHAKAHPSRPMPKHHVCTNNPTESDSMYTQALSRQNQIHSELSKAMDEWLELSVFRQMQTHLLRSITSSCTNQNQCGKGEK